MTLFPITLALPTERMHYFIYYSSYELAVNSIDSKKFERLEAAKKIHNELMATYPETKYIDKSTKMIESIDKEITTFAKNITVQ